MAITLYTLPDCAQCETTKLYLEKNKLAYETVEKAPKKLPMGVLDAATI